MLYFKEFEYVEPNKELNVDELENFIPQYLL